MQIRYLGRQGCIRVGHLNGGPYEFRSGGDPVEVMDLRDAQQIIRMFDEEGERMFEEAAPVSAGHRMEALAQLVTENRKGRKAQRMGRAN